jgi:hypothetical protein
MDTFAGDTPVMAIGETVENSARNCNQLSTKSLSGQENGE